jgi:hypothetical protein
MPITKKDILIFVLLLMIPYVGWLIGLGYIAKILLKDERQGRGRKTPESHSPSPALPMLPA